MSPDPSLLSGDAGDAGDSTDSLADQILAFLSGQGVDLDLHDGHVIARDRSKVTDEIRGIVRQNIREIRDELDGRRLGAIARQPRRATPVLAVVETIEPESATPWWEEPSWTVDRWIADVAEAGVHVEWTGLRARLVPKHGYVAPWIASDRHQLEQAEVFIAHFGRGEAA